MKILPSLFAFSLSEENVKRPNVILLLADDFGMGDFQINNSRAKVPTPNIDRIGKEGINFRDGHSASSRCAPSRYMLMTGRYSLGIERNRILKKGTPHLGEMFKKAGYRTAVIGKDQPLNVKIKNTSISNEKANEIMNARIAYKKKNFGEDMVRDPGMDNKNFYVPGDYKMTVSQKDFNYDYAFTSTSPCCLPAGFFENGVGIEPFDRYAIQRPFPEGVENRSKDGFSEEIAKRDDFWSYHTFNPFYRWSTEEESITARFKSGYVAEPFFEEPEYGPVLMGNYPSSILVQNSYDSRNAEDVILPRALNFIEENANQDEPFFMYYGLRSGHRPFNSPERYRNTTEAGLVGEMIKEVDENVGILFDKLEELGIDDDTLMVFMSDNGADQSSDFSWMKYGHMQNSMDIDDRPSVPLRGTKNTPYEGGHRNSFMWRWPAKWAPQTIETTTVSYLDVFGTLADIIGYERKCNEAPDSRSLVPLIEKGEKPFPEEVIHHSVAHKISLGGVALRQGDWKWIPGTNELFHIGADRSEKRNKYEDRPALLLKPVKRQMNETLNEILAKIDEREALQNEGALEICM
ncbi:Oidioi.mRNA.OKI2018_I69.chr2.g4575.t1.cds [Oikopleura dioica]|uniref:Oidioi.mRNA.OKI2018_I69.chr2.g4575.t1.cds n=1 Tax=Oikopleura dioica TaxID=34765 RepID=A0ABN7T386_OIKDI|nr:Oidioi.mRNA.OKI2018_I69.chr2.g4575.t1.cds [Oikopleura dioica]